MYVCSMYVYTYIYIHTYMYCTCTCGSMYSISKVYIIFNQRSCKGGCRSNIITQTSTPVNQRFLWCSCCSSKLRPKRHSLLAQWNHEDFSILILNMPSMFKRNIHRYTFQYSFPVFKIGTLVVWPAVDLSSKRHTNSVRLFDQFRLNLINLDRFG